LVPERSQAARLPHRQVNTLHSSETTTTPPITICLTNDTNTSPEIARLSRSQWYRCHAPKNSSGAHANCTTVQLGILKFQTLLLVVLLFVCTCTYLHGVFPAFLDRNKNGYANKSHRELSKRKESESDELPRPLGTFWRAARVGERLSPYVSLCCMAMAVSLIRDVVVNRRVLTCC
jgi:hypothetical protein